MSDVIVFLLLFSTKTAITMELVETLQQAIVGKTITNDYIDNVCARLGLARLRESMPESARLGYAE